MVSLLFWGDNQKKGQSGCPTAPERWKKGTGISCRPNSPAPYTSPCLGSTCTSGFPGSREAAALLTSSFGKKQMENADLAVLEHCCWALLLQFTENQSCNKILPEGSKSLRLFVFNVVILNCSKLFPPWELCYHAAPLLPHLYRLVQGGVTAGHILRWFTSDFREQFPRRTSVTWHKHTSGVHQQAPLPWATSWHHSKTHGAHRRLLVLGSAYQWEVGRLSSPTLWVHTSPLKQDWGVISPRLYFMLNILICCPKVLWAGTWQSISKLK